MVSVVLVGVEPSVKEYILNILGSDLILDISNKIDFEKFLDCPPESEISCVIAGADLEEVTPNEIGQGFQMLSTNIQQIFVTSKQSCFDTVQLVKDGFHFCSLYPMDQEMLNEFLLEVKSRQSGEKLYKSVFFADLDAQQKLDFDVYLFMPNNKKYIKYVGKDNSLSKDQFERLTKSSSKKAHISSSELSKFYEFTAKRLMALNQDPMSSETEKRDRLQKSVRVIFSELFSSSEDLASLSGRKTILSNAKNIIQKFIESSGQQHIQKALMAQVGSDKQSYSHPTNVSIFSSLFSLALGVADPGNMAVAGLMHDIGKDFLSITIRSKDTKDLTAEERKIYEKHPNESIQMLKKLNLPLSDDVHRAVLHHHERIDGSGFPSQLAGRFVSVEGQILAIADQFDILTRQVMGKITMTPMEALNEMQKNSGLNQDYILQLKNLFVPTDGAAANTA